MPPCLRGRVLAQMLLAYILGLLLAAWLKPPFLPGAALAGLLSLTSAFTARRHQRAAAALLLLAMLALGCFMGARATERIASFPVRPGEEAALYGQASGSSVYRGEGRYRLLLSVREVNGAPWRGQVYLYYEGGPLVSGEMVAARGQVMLFTPYGNPGAFDFDAYMKRQGIAAAINCYREGEVRGLNGFATPGVSARERLLDAFQAAAGDNSALLKGVFLGDKSELSFNQRSALAFSGVLHAFAVSGLHVGYLVGAALLLVGQGRRKRWPRLLLTFSLLLFYLHLTGTPASILRASLMALCMLAAGALDEKSDPWTALSLAAWLCLLYKPLWLFDAGFQLSFAAAAGLLYLLPVMNQLLGNGFSHGTVNPPVWLGKLAPLLSKTFAVTLAASFGTMPLIGYYFYHISIIGWLVSPLFVLGAGLTVLLCFIASLAAVFSVALATLPLFATDLIMRALMELSLFSTSLPGAYIASGHTPLWAVLAFYAGLLALPLLAHRFRRPRLFMLAALSVLLLSLAPALERAANGQLEVVFLDVGQGDAALIITPDGHSVLIDGGGDRTNSGQVGENALLPYLRYRGLRRIDVLISSHPDADHVDGLFTVLENMPVGQLLYADVFPESALQQRLLNLARLNGAQLVPAYAGQSFSLEAGLTLAILNPPTSAAYSERENNQGCLSCLFSYGQVNLLFTGDASFADLADIPPAQIVKLPHHGSLSGYDEQAYAQLQPAAVIVSVGRANSYGHPAAAVVEYWQGRATLFRTDQDGAITIKSDGQSWQARAYWQ